MRTFCKRALWGTLLAGGITLLGATAATAAETTGDDGLLSGSQAVIDVTLPVTVSGTSLSVIGDSHSDGSTAAAPTSDPAPADATTGGQDGAASGTQALVSVNVPVTVAGNAVSVAGDSESSDATTAPAPAAQPAAAETSGDDGILSGTQGVVSVAAPVTVSGNAI